jgi:hypothetical protein
MTFLEMVTTYGVGAIAALAFIVNLVVELTKNIGVLKRVPTDAYTIVMSILLTIAAYFAAIGAQNAPFVWYELLLAILGGFVVAYVSMYSWSKLIELWGRFKKQ